MRQARQERHGKRCHLILTDDLAVRDTAKRLQLTPVGSLGIVVRAYRQGIITFAAAEHALIQLHVELAIEQLRQHASRDKP